MKEIVQIHNVYVRRSATFRLCVKDFTAAASTITCITGPNGSGKSTFIEIIAGLLRPEAGTVSINGATNFRSLRNTRALLGYIPDDEEWFIKELCAREYFDLLCDIYRRAGSKMSLEMSWQALAKRLFFTSLDIPIQQLSHGNKKKVQIIAALMHSPPLVIVDEIRNGLDPFAIMATEKLLKDHALSGACVIAATHDLWWAERIADTIVMLSDGSVKIQLPVAQAKKEYSSLEAMFMKLAAHE